MDSEQRPTSLPSDEVGQCVVQNGYFLAYSGPKCYISRGATFITPHSMKLREHQHADALSPGEYKCASASFFSSVQIEILVVKLEKGKQSPKILIWKSSSRDHEIS